MTWESFVGPAITVLSSVGGGLVAAMAYIRTQEKRTDKHEHTLYGENGQNGLKARIQDLEDWREGKPPYGPKNLESRCIHGAAGEIQNRVMPHVDDLNRRVDVLEHRKAR